MEIDAVDVPVIPPIPGDFPGANPGRVFNIGGTLQQINELVSDQVTVVVGDAKHSPRKRARAGCDRNVVGGFHNLVVAIAGLLLL